MVSELAGDLIRVIVEQRSRLAGDSHHFLHKQHHLDPIIQRVKQILAEDGRASIRLFLAPSKCDECDGNERTEAEETTECRHVVEIESWIFRVDKCISGGGEKSGILPLFLRQAILSQLHFSSFNAWLLERHAGRLPADYRIAYRLSTDSDFPSKEKSKLHNFPACIVGKDEKQLLKVYVKWVCKHEFPTLAERCESPPAEKPADDTPVLPPTNDTKQPARPIESTGSRETTHRAAIPINTQQPTHSKFNPSSIPSSCRPLLMEQNRRIRRHTYASEPAQPQSSSRPFNGSPVPWNTKQTTSAKLLRGSPIKSSLLCNFEESALNCLKGLEPVANVEGFRLQIIVQGRLNVPTMEIPLNTYFFNVSDDNTPSLYFGHAALETPVRISKRSTIQATLFNPQGSVMKIFIVPIDVRDMPPSSKTFLRHRTYCMPVDVPVVEEAKCSWLRYLVHFRLMTDRHGRLHLHSDIRMLFSNKIDLDVQTLASGGREFQFLSSVEFPQEPKYSGIN